MDIHIELDHSDISEKIIKIKWVSRNFPKTLYKENRLLGNFRIGVTCLNILSVTSDQIIHT